MDVPLTPLVVDVVTFDRAPLGRRGYNEDQVDDFLDRIQATLAGEDNLTAAEVRAVEFDPAPFIRRGYHEDQVDEFLDLVVEELDRREGNPPGGGAPATDSAVGVFPWSRTPVAVSGPPIAGGMPGNSPTYGTGNAPAGTPGSTNLTTGTPGMSGNAAAGSPGRSSTPGSHLASGPSGTSGTPSNTPAGTPAPTSNPSHTNTPDSANPATGTPGTGGVPSNGPAGTTPGSNHLTAGSPGTTSIPSPGNYPGHAPGSGNYPASGGNPSAGSPGSTSVPGPGNAPGSGNYPASGGNPSAGPGSSGGDHPDPIAWLPFPPAQPRVVPPLTPAEQTNPMLFAQPPSWPSPSTQPLKREPEAASGPPNPSVAATTDETGAPRETEPGESPVHPASVEAGQAASALRAGATSEMVEEPEPDSPKRTLADYAPKQPPPDAAPARTEPTQTEPTQTEPTREAPDTTAEDASGQAEPTSEPEPTFPLPPAPPGEPGYAPSDVARLMKLLTTAPDREQLTNLTFSLTTTGGYHTGTVDALHQAWIDALPTKQP